MQSLDSALKNQKPQNQILPHAHTRNSNYTNNYNSKNYISEQFSDLIDDSNFLPWFASQLKRIGRKQFEGHAETARREGKAPARFFVWLIKNSETVSRVRDLAEFIRDRLKAGEQHVRYYLKAAWHLPEQAVKSLAARVSDVPGNPGGYFNKLAEGMINGKKQQV